MNIFLALVISLGINLLMFIPAFILKTDKLTDISYSITFIVLVLYSFFINDVSLLTILLLIMVVIWAIRLGGYLLIRIRKIGKDKRFDDRRENFFSFLKFWILQGVSVFFIMIPILLFMNIENKEFNFLVVFGIIIWLGGLILESVADYQKYKFINDPLNKDKWIDKGVWKYSRHPNYLGEMMIWIGLYLFMLPSFSFGQSIFGLMGPLYIILLINFVSGIPLLEKGANKKWGNNIEYKSYKKRVGILLPKFF